MARNIEHFLVPFGTARSKAVPTARRLRRSTRKWRAGVLSAWPWGRTGFAWRTGFRSKSSGFWAASALTPQHGPHGPVVRGRLSRCHPGAVYRERRTGDTGGPFRPLPSHGAATAFPSEVAAIGCRAGLGPHLRRMASTWWSTVAHGDHEAVGAIWPFCQPPFTNASTSNSRAATPVLVLEPVVGRGPRQRRHSAFAESSGQIAAAGRPRAPAAPPTPAAAAPRRRRRPVEGGLVGHPASTHDARAVLRSRRAANRGRTRYAGFGGPRPARCRHTPSSSARAESISNSDRQRQLRGRSNAVRVAPEPSSFCAGCRHAAPTDRSHRLVGPSPTPRRAEVDDRGPPAWPGRARGPSGR